MFESTFIGTLVGGLVLHEFICNFVEIFSKRASCALVCWNFKILLQFFENIFWKKKKKRGISIENKALKYSLVIFSICIFILLKWRVSSVQKYTLMWIMKILYFFTFWFKIFFINSNEEWMKDYFTKIVYILYLVWV